MIVPFSGICYPTCIHLLEIAFNAGAIIGTGTISPRVFALVSTNMAPLAHHDTNHSITAPRVHLP
jgi:hypothetical protein